MVREGRKTAQEIQDQFESLLRKYSELTPRGVVDLKQFRHLFSFISAWIRKDTDFDNFVDYSFRYNMLLKKNLNLQQKSQQGTFYQQFSELRVSQDPSRAHPQQKSQNDPDH